MNILDKRPLSLILCIMLGAFVFFSTGNSYIRTVLIALIPTIFIIAIFLKALTKSQRIMLSFVSLVITISCLFSFVYFDLWYNADKRFTEQCVIEGTVESINFEGRTKYLDITADSVDDKPLTSYKFIVELKDEDIINITVGSEIKFSAKLYGLDSYYSSEQKSYYISKGYSAVAREVENIEILGNGEKSLSSKLTDYRLSLTRKMVLRSDKTSGGLLAALLLGERAYLNGQLALDFSRIGISHALALSGMNMVILCYGFSSLLSFFHVGKKSRKLSEILLAIFYMALTGFPVSVVRAGLMLIISSSLFLLSKSKDSITNLFISVTLICLFAPYSVYDMSLWLSAFATLGIIVAGTIFSGFKSKNVFLKFVFWVSSSLISSVFAIISTLALSAFSFDTISLISPISTLIFSPILLLFTYVGIFFLLTASFIPTGELVSFIGGFVADFANFFSSFRYVLLSTDYILIKVLILIITILLFFFLILDIRRRKTAALLLCALFVSTLMCSLGFAVAENKKIDFSYCGEYEYERLLLKSDSETSLIDVSVLSNESVYETLGYLKSNRILYLDSYIITNYSSHSPAAFEILFNNIMIESIYLPTPKTQAEEYVCDDLMTMAKYYSVNIITYEEESIININDFDIFPVFSDEYGRCAFTILYNDEFYTYVSANMLDYSTRIHAMKIMNGANTVIIGSKGSSVSNPDFIYKLSPNTKLIYNNKKSGLPAETLKYYENRIIVNPTESVDLYVK